MPQGAIKLLIPDHGFGMSKTGQGEDVFFHHSQLQGVDFSSLREGQQVEYEVGQGRNGRSEAHKVRLVEPKTE